MRVFLGVMAAALVLASACGGESGADDPPTPTASVAPTRPADGCSGQRPAADATKKVRSGGVERSYVLHLPPSYDGSTRTPLLIVFHGFSMTAAQMTALTGLPAAADAHGMVTALPEGSGRQQGWNVDALSGGPDDSLFTADLISTLERSLCIDPGRVYLAGFSNGGAMAYTAACALGGRVTAIAVVAGYTSCRAAVPLIAFHGTSDATVPFDGGPGPSGGLIYEPVSDTVAAWAKVMGCAEPATSVPASGVVITTYGGCEAGEGAVQLYAVDGGGHSWPGSALDLVGQGPTSRAVDATDLMLDFFDRHR